MRMMAQTKHVEFTSVIDDSLPDVFHSDFNRLFQILLNLISNAIKFSSHKKKRSKQGKVKLVVKCMSEKDRSPGVSDYPTPESPSSQYMSSRMRYTSMLASDKDIDNQLTFNNSASMLPCGFCFFAFFRKKIMLYVSILLINLYIFFFLLVML